MTQHFETGFLSPLPFKSLFQHPPPPPQALRSFLILIVPERKTFDTSGITVLPPTGFTGLPHVAADSTTHQSGVVLVVVSKPIFQKKENRDKLMEMAGLFLIQY